MTCECCREPERVYLKIGNVQIRLIGCTKEIEQLMHLIRQVEQFVLRKKKAG